jgi:hypothetical protein
MTILHMVPLDADTTVLDLLDSVTLGTGSVAISAGNGRSGGASLRITNSALASKTFPAAIATANVAGAFATSSLTSSATVGGMALWDGSTATPQVSLKFNPDGSISAYRGSILGTLLGTSAAGVIVVTAQQHIEVNVTISATVGVVQVWVNSVSVLNLTSQNTKSTANTTVSGAYWSSGYTGTGDWSDLILANARITDLRVEWRAVTGAGNYTQFTPSAGSNYQNVDESPPNNDTDYNETATVNNIDSFTHAALSASPLSIAAVQVFVRARNTTSGAGSIAPLCRSGSTDSVGTAVALSTSFATFGTVYTNDPATGSPWANAAAVDASEIGYKKTV